MTRARIPGMVAGRQSLVTVDSPAGRSGVRRRAVAVSLSALGIALVVIAWEAIVRLGNVSQVVLPSPAEVAVTGSELVRSGSFWNDVRVSLEEFFFGFAGGALAGYIIGVLLGLSNRWRQYVGPVVELFRFVIPFSWIPLTVLWFGTSLFGKEVLVGYAVFFIVAISVEDAVRAIDPRLLKVARMMGLSGIHLLFRVYLRGSLTRTISGVRVAIGVGWIALVAAEYVGSSAGLGYMVINAEQELSTSTIIVGMICIGLIGSGLTALLGPVEKRINFHAKSR